MSEIFPQLQAQWQRGGVKTRRNLKRNNLYTSIQGGTKHKKHRIVVAPGYASVNGVAAAPGYASINSYYDFIPILWKKKNNRNIRINSGNGGYGKTKQFNKYNTYIRKTNKRKKNK